jgi:N-acetylglucosaminyldiphosphoundecaprenol N-acetyl-beta-D-mannosaminyltransferase
LVGSVKDKSIRAALGSADNRSEEDHENRILGVRVDPVTLQQCVRWASESIANRERDRYVAVVNVAKLVKARKDATLRDSLGMASIVGADGVPIVWVSGLLGQKLPGRVAGVDLMYELLERGNQNGWAFYFLGAEEVIVRKVVQRAKALFPGIVIAGFRNGYFLESEETQIVNDIRASHANVLFLGFGSPKKEHFVKRWLGDLHVNVVHGVGGSFDLLAGKTTRAPVWMQRSGLEWLYRLVQEPGRMFGRYAITNTIFIGLVTKEVIGRILSGNR